MPIISSECKIALRIEPFVVDIYTRIPSVIDSIKHLYSDYPYINMESDYFADFHVGVDYPRNLRKWYRPQVLFYADDIPPFKPLPLSQAYPLFEWGLNWCIATSVHQYLIIHAAVIEKNGKALILCGRPGAGKSTLCAALVGAGWRLLSDEMAVINLKSKNLIPVVRPISLKNQSIEIIKKWAPELVWGKAFTDTAKGTVAHLKPPTSSILQAKIEAQASWIVFPQYSENQKELLLENMPKGQAVLKLAENSFNYNVLGEDGFSCVCDLVERSECYNFAYNNLDQSVRLFSDWASSS